MINLCCVPFTFKDISEPTFQYKSEICCRGYWSITLADAEHEHFSKMYTLDLALCKTDLKTQKWTEDKKFKL